MAPEISQKDSVTVYNSPPETKRPDINLKIQVDNIKAELSKEINIALSMNDISIKEQSTLIKKSRFDSYCKLTILYSQHNKYDKALPYAAALYQMDMNNEVFKYNLANILNKLNSGKIAIVLGLNLIRSHPDNPQYHSLLATSYSIENKHSEALKYMLIASSISPNEFEYLASIGLLYKKLGNIHSAIEYYRKSLEINPNNVSVNMEISELYYMQRNNTLSKKFLMIAKSLSPDNKLIQ